MATLPNSIDAYRTRASDLYKQGADMYGAALDAQEGQGESSMLNALAAQYAGENFQPLQAQFLKKAMGAEDTKSKRAEFLMSQAKAYEQLAQSADTARERLAAEQQYRSIMAGIAGMNAQTNRMRAEQGAGGHFTQSGYTPEGKQLVTNNTGMNFILEQGAGGQPVYTPYTGASIPKASFEKGVVDAQALQGTAARANALVKQVEDNPAAFGLRGAAVSALPGGAQGYAARAMGMTPEQMEARATVLRQAAQEVNDLYGAALSMQENAKAATFIPNASDDPTAIITKLKAARDWANSKLTTGHAPGVVNAANARANTPTTNQDAGGGGLSLAERNELNRLRQKHRGGE